MPPQQSGFVGPIEYQQDNSGVGDAKQNFASFVSAVGRKTTLPGLPGSTSTYETMLNSSGLSEDKRRRLLIVG